MLSRSSVPRTALAVLVVTVLVTAATSSHAVFAGLSLWFLPEGAASSAYFVAMYLLSRLVVVTLAAWIGAALARGSVKIVAAAATAVLGLFDMALLANSQQPATWFNYGGLVVLVGGTLFGVLLRRQ